MRNRNFLSLHIYFVIVIVISFKYIHIFRIWKWAKHENVWKSETRHLTQQSAEIATEYSGQYYNKNRLAVQLQ